jgi:glycerol-3-phosphate dehydrogenase
LLARIVPLPESAAFQMEAQFVVNAAGPFAGSVAAMAGVRLPMALGKGTLVAMASRLTHTVLSRCKPPHDGDIIVPVGTVCVLGTTDVPVRSPADLAIEPWEIDLLLGEGQVLIPTLRRHRTLRAWAGIRALYRPPREGSQPPPRRSPSPGQARDGDLRLDEAATRALPRAHALIDHATSDGVNGLVSIIGGKLTTYRKMAEDVVHHIAGPARVSRPCRTASTVLPRSPRRYFALGERPSRIPAAPQASVVCECELVFDSEIKEALLAGAIELDDLRRDLRLGMGPCQGAFCAYRAAGAASVVQSEPGPDGGLGEFVQARWRGMRPLAWGRGLRQVELLRRIQVELLGAGSGEIEVH